MLLTGTKPWLVWGTVHSHSSVKRSSHFFIFSFPTYLENLWKSVIPGSAMLLTKRPRQKTVSISINATSSKCCNLFILWCPARPEIFRKIHSSIRFSVMLLTDKDPTSCIQGAERKGHPQNSRDCSLYHVRTFRDKFVKISSSYFP